jgi:pimeloyl-ACP methyl ester carboxylesterase
VKVIERGTGLPVVFLHSGVGSAGEWKQVFSCWPPGYRLLAIEAYGGRVGPVLPGLPGRRTLDDYADQVYAVVEDVGAQICVIGFSWGGATALRVASQRPELVGALAVVEPEAYSLLPNDTAEYVQIRTLRDRWRAHVRAGRWYEAFEEFIDFYNGPASFAQWPPGRRSEFLSIQQARGDLWDVLFHGLAAEALAAITAPVHVIEGSRSSPVDRAICRIVRQEVRNHDTR